MAVTDDKKKYPRPLRESGKRVDGGLGLQNRVNNATRGRSLFSTEADGNLPLTAPRNARPITNGPAPITRYAPRRVSADVAEAGLRRNTPSTNDIQDTPAPPQRSPMPMQRGDGSFVNEPRRQQAAPGMTMQRGDGSFVNEPRIRRGRGHNTPVGQLAQAETDQRIKLRDRALDRSFGAGGQGVMSGGRFTPLNDAAMRSLNNRRETGTLADGSKYTFFRDGTEGLTPFQQAQYDSQVEQAQRMNRASAEAANTYGQGALSRFVSQLAANRRQGRRETLDAAVQKAVVKNRNRTTTVGENEYLIDDATGQIIARGPEGDRQVKIDPNAMKFFEQTTVDEFGNETKGLDYDGVTRLDRLRNRVENYDDTTLAGAIHEINQYNATRAGQSGAREIMDDELIDLLQNPSLADDFYQKHQWLPTALQ